MAGSSVKVGKLTGEITAASAEEIYNQTEEMKTFVGELAVMIGGDATGHFRASLARSDARKTLDKTGVHG